MIIVSIPKQHRLTVKYINDITETKAIVEVNGELYEVTKLNRTHYLLEFDFADICEENRVDLEED